VNKFLEKIAAKLPADAKDLARNIIRSTRKGHTILEPHNFMGKGYADAAPGSMRHDIYRARKLADRVLNKAAALLKGKRLIAKIKGDRFRFLGKVKDIDSFNRIHSLHDTASRQQKMGVGPVKHRLEMGDGSKGFIRISSKGVRSRLYRE